jgi:phytoene synthase
MVVSVLGSRDPEEARRRAEDLGMAMQLTNIMRDLREDAVRRRVYLPQDEMREAGYTNEELFAFARNRAFRALMERQERRAREFFFSSRRLMPLLPRRARYCPMLISAIYENVLDEIARHGYDVFSARRSLSRSRLWWLTFKTFFRSLP